MRRAPRAGAGLATPVLWKSLSKAPPVNRPLLLLLLSLTVSACAKPPAISVLGAFFPDWLFCAIGGLVMTLIVRALAIRFGHEQTLGPPLLVLPALMLLFSLLAWLLFF
ncbi:hypothetical protein AWB71_03384 [Caballeronia peredens]|nr:hypothetical protein AWB71_03384 [Caballeronia peredens]